MLQSTRRHQGESHASSLVPLLAALSFHTGCSSIDRTAAAQQPLNKALLAGPGDLVLRVERERNLENAFGKADIFGRKTKEGFTELRFAGVESSGEIVLSRKDVQVVTNETTMSRTPISTTTGRATTNVSGTATPQGNSTRVQGTATTNLSSTTIAPIQDFHVVVPSDAVAIRLASNERRVPLAGFVIEIISASANSLEYRVLKLE
jgi:hypothetical protein